MTDVWISRISKFVVMIAVIGKAMYAIVKVQLIVIIS